MHHAELHIKNMVCGRCLKAVTEILNQFDFETTSVDLGKAFIESKHPIDRLKIAEALDTEGFELSVLS